MTISFINTKIVTPLIIIAISHILSSCISAHNIRQPEQDLPSARPIIIMTYNIRIGAGRHDYARNLYTLKDEKTYNLTPVIEAIRSVDPDIIGLQEVLGERQAAQIGHALNMNYAYVPYGMEKFDTWWGMAILSKFPLLEISSQHITFGSERINSNLIANITIFGKKTVIFCMHKNPYLTDGNTFRMTMKEITKVKEAVILLGDLNIFPNDGRHDILSSRFKDTALVHTEPAEFARKRGTYLGEYGDRLGRRIDYILVDKANFKVMDAGVLKEKYWLASDHIGYYATVSFK